MKKKTGRTAAQRIDWDHQPLGKISDYRLAKLLGVTQTAARQARVCRGIPASRDTNGHMGAWSWKFGEHCIVRDLEAGLF